MGFGFRAHPGRHCPSGKRKQLLPGFGGVLRFIPFFEVERAPVIGQGQFLVRLSQGKDSFPLQISITEMLLQHISAHKGKVWFKIIAGETFKVGYGSVGFFHFHITQTPV
jgi:hypothetical protein